MCLWAGRESRCRHQRSIVCSRPTANGTALHIWPHLLSHCYAVERLAYLQDIGGPNPLKVVQMELGHAHMATTERYLHLTERMRSEVIETHNSFVDRLLEG